MKKKRKHPPMAHREDYEITELRQRFKLICLKCGSDNIALDLDKGIDYGGATGYSPGTLSFGCNACKENDYFMSVG
jgi:hypothetical protein